MKTILLFFASFLVLQVQAQQTNITLIHNFKGKIDQYPVEINLRSNLQNDTITGSYYYTKKGRDKNIFLEGTLKNNTLTLKEVVYTTLNGNSIKKTSGNFKLLLNSNNWNLNGNWFSPDRQKQYQVNLISREVPQKNDPSKNSYRSTIYQSETEGLCAETKKTNKIRSFEISDSNGNFIQKITSLDQCISDHQVEIEFEDLNFDGILDLKILKIFPDRIKNDYAFLYFIYNPETKKYVRNSKLETLEVLSFEPANKVMVRYEADGRGNESTFNYKWEANEPFLIKKESSFENDSYTYYTEYQIIGKKSVKVKEYKKK